MQFKEIIGHNIVKKQLINTARDGRISHAQLFLGKEGSGNLAMAIAYAQFISCTNKQEIDSCGECPSCIKYNNLVHPDLHFIFPVATNQDVKKDPVSTNFLIPWREMFLEEKYFSLAMWQDKIETGNKQLLISKNESTEILKILSLKTYESEYKVVIIWYPERFNIASANKLLKAIEEPPPKTLFLLIAQDKEQIISTIISRTQIVNVGRIEEDELQKALIQEFQINEKTAQQVAHLSDGNYIAAKKIIEYSEIEDLFYNLFTNWMRSAFKGNVLGLVEWTDEIAKASFGREKQKQFLNFGLRIFRESLIRNYGSDDLERAGDKVAQFLVKFAPYIHGANCIEIIELFNDAIYHIERNANPKILFLDLSLKLTKLLRVKAPAIEN
jgi:DNA polymerase-3 subunit delta'